MNNAKRTFKWSAWLGWQLESNWTQPFIFAIYALIKPIASAMILVVMYMVIAEIGGVYDSNMFEYIYIGNAFFMFVGQLLWGVTWIIHDDREHYRTLKYIYISPSSYIVYMIGRSICKIAITTFAVIITLAFGIFFLDISISAFAINWPLFIGVILIGLACLLAFGMALAGISFLTAKHSMGMNEGVAGIFFLFCGVIFPISILPEWGIAFGKILPITYWLDLLRTSLGAGTGVDTAVAGTSVTYSLFVLIVSTLVFAVFSYGAFKLGDHIARKKGLIDMTTAY